MNIQKIIATIMILAGSLLIAAVFRDIAFPAILCMLGLLGLQRRFTWDIRPERRFITSLLLLLLTVLFALHYSYAGLSRRMTQEAISIVAWGTIARYFLASMILILFLGSPHRLPSTLALFYMATVISAGQVLLLDDYYMPFRLLEVVSVVLVVLYAATGRASESPVTQEVQRGPRSWWLRSRQAVKSGACADAATPDPMPKSRWRLGEHGRLWSDHWVVSGLILLLAINLGWISSTVLYRNVELLNYVPVWLWNSGVGLEPTPDTVAHVGFSTSGELSNILLMQGDQDTTPVLRIKSEANPGYLRARAFDLYRPSKWSDVSAVRGVEASQNMPFSGSLPGRMNSFHFSRQRPDHAREMMVRHVLPIRDAMFTPLGTLGVDAPLPYVNYDDGIVSPPYPRTNLSYRVTFAGPAYAPAPTRSMLDVPSQMDPRVQQLADRVFAGATTTAEKIQAVVHHFQTHYTYSLGLSIPPGRDKLAFFLLEASSGYCEYFASGAAILLRMADVPTRYITGFFVTAKDDDDETWLARNMDAHAWVEAWDEENRQWMIVEATVQSGLNAVSEDDKSDQAGSGNTYLLLSLLVDNLYEYGLFGVLAWALQYYGLPAISFLLALTLGLTLYWLYRRTRSARSGYLGATLSAELLALRRILARMDRHMKAAGARRHPGETLHAFAQRLDAQDPGDGSWTAASDWYLQYANLRYGKTIPASRLDQLTQRIVRPACRKRPAASDEQKR